MLSVKNYEEVDTGFSSEIAYKYSGWVKEGQMYQTTSQVNENTQ